MQVQDGDATTQRWRLLAAGRLVLPIQAEQLRLVIRPRPACQDSRLESPVTNLELPRKYLACRIRKGCGTRLAGRLEMPNRLRLRLGLSVCSQPEDLAVGLPSPLPLVGSGALESNVCCRDPRPPVGLGRPLFPRGLVMEMEQAQSSGAEQSQPWPIQPTDRTQGQQARRKHLVMHRIRKITGRCLFQPRLHECASPKRRRGSRGVFFLLGGKRTPHSSFCGYDIFLAVNVPPCQSGKTENAVASPAPGGGGWACQL